MNHAGDPPTRFCKKCGQEDHGSAGCHTGPKRDPRMSLGDKGSEKLPEQIILGIKMCLAGYGVGNEDAEGVMEYVLSAVRDGKAKIPGEARRTWLDEFEGYCEEEYGTHRVIILFPEDLVRYKEGTGKEGADPEEE